jgi:hypothetical protein
MDGPGGSLDAENEIYVITTIKTSKLPMKTINNLRYVAIFMRLCFSLTTLVACASCSKKDGGNPSGVTPTGGTTATASFTVKGSKIIDPSGNEFIAKGVNVNGPYWPWSRPTIPDVPLIIDVWKFNTVRVNTWPQFSAYNSNNTDLDGIVKAFTDKKVVVIIEDHNFTGKYPTASELTDLTTWWVATATKYKDNPYVWFNIMNEPGSSGPAPVNWLNDHQVVIKAIRGAGINNIIVCDESAYGQANGYDNSTSSGILTYGSSLTSYKNIVFSLHTYTEWTYGDDRLKNYISAVQANNLALIIGEYGAGPDVSAEVATSVFKDAIAAKAGRIAWQWTGVDIYKLTTNDGGFAIDNTSGAKPGNLSFTGNLVWDDNHTGIDPAGSELTPPAVIVFNNSFELGPPVSGSALANNWINFGTAIYDNSPANVSDGLFSAEIPAGSAGGFSQPIYLQPGATYTITAWGKNSVAPSVATNVGINIQTSFNGSQTALVMLNFTTVGAGTQSATFTTPANIAGLSLFAYKTDVSSIFWCDNIVITKM